MNSDSIVLSNSQQVELSRIAQSRSLPAGYVFRVRLILMLAENAPFSTIKNRLGTNGAHHQPLEAALPCLGNRRLGYQPSWTIGLGIDSEAASPGSVGYPYTTATERSRCMPR